VDAVAGLEHIFSVALSPDGAHVYAVGSGEGAIGVFGRDGGTGEVTFQSGAFEGVGGVMGLDNPVSVAVSPDGDHVYVACTLTDAVLALARDTGTGALAFVGAQVDDQGGVDGMDLPIAIALSPDGFHVYVLSGGEDDAIAVFERDAGTGALTFVEMEPVGDVDDFRQPGGIAVSPDGAHLYVAAADFSNPGGILVFDRDGVTGALTFVEAEIDGVNGVTGVVDANASAVSPDGGHVYVVSPDMIAVFDRDAGTGELTFVEALGENAADSDVTVSPDGAHVYVAGDFRFAAFDRDTGTGELTLVESEFQGILNSASSIRLSPDGAHAYVGGHDEDALVVFERDQSTGELTLLSSVVQRVELLRGKRLTIKNAVPDADGRNRGVWIARDAVSLWSNGNPLCLGDPAGTVKASIRFHSLSSGHDSGEIALPCENWRGGNGYTYRDSGPDEGPCQTVRVRGDRIKAICRAKGTTTDFPYDLTGGVSEGRVIVELRIGNVRYCSSFESYLAGKDGSNGKRLGAGDTVASPVSCPFPVGSPSAAFLDTPASVLDWQ
jgi:DNA-binding beta-propeller fold protein YncE